MIAVGWPSIGLHGEDDSRTRRGKKKKDDEPQTTERVRYTVIKAYDAAAIGIVGSFTAPTKDDVFKDDGSGDKQFFAPTISNLVEEISAGQDHGQCSERSLPAKRNIAFDSKAGMSAQPGEAIHQESTISSMVMPLAGTKDGVESPLKKTKDKEKKKKKELGVYRMMTCTSAVF